MPWKCAPDSYETLSIVATDGPLSQDRPKCLCRVLFARFYEISSKVEYSRNEMPAHVRRMLFFGRYCLDLARKLSCNEISPVGRHLLGEGIFSEQIDATSWGIGNSLRSRDLWLWIQCSRCWFSATGLCAIGIFWTSPILRCPMRPTATAF